MWEFFVFAVTGLLAGAAARLWYPGREPMRVLGTMLLGMAGSLLGGLVAWAAWPQADGLIYPGALLTSLLGAVLVLAAWPWAAYTWGRRRPQQPVL